MVNIDNSKKADKLPRKLRKAVFHTGTGVLFYQKNNVSLWHVEIKLHEEEIVAFLKYITLCIRRYFKIRVFKNSLPLEHPGTFSFALFLFVLLSSWDFLSLANEDCKDTTTINLEPGLK